MSTPKPYQPARLRRVREITHGLTLDLYLRREAFWQGIHQVRAVWHYADVPRAIPLPFGQPREPDALLYHQPPGYRFPGRRYDDLSDAWDAFFAFCRDWLPSFPQGESTFALVFLSGCVWFDPPEDDLIGFANHADNLLSGWHPAGERTPPPPGLPVVWIPDLEALMRDSAAEADLSDYRFLLELKAALVDALDAQGLDGDAIWTAAEEATLRGSSFLKLGYGLPTTQPEPRGPAWWQTWAGSQPYITVQPDTSEADVRAAFGWLKQRLPTPVVPSLKTPRDPLLCLQCAIWRDQLDWSEHRIGTHCGWTIQHPPNAKPRCETARQHIAEGRLLLARRPDAA